jgi:hypothetical protein
LALAEWGCWDDELGDVTRAALQAAYVRRKRYEARLIALEIWSVLGEALEGGNERVGTSGARYREMEPEALIEMIGAEG